MRAPLLVDDALDAARRRTAWLVDALRAAASASPDARPAGSDELVRDVSARIGDKLDPRRRYALEANEWRQIALDAQSLLALGIPDVGAAAIATLANACALGAAGLLDGLV